MSVDKKVALALLEEVHEAVDSVLGDTLVIFGTEAFDPERANFCEKYIRQCDLAEKKVPDDKEVILKSLLLKSQLYGCWVKPGGVRKTHKKAKECYEKLLELAFDKQSEALFRYNYAIFCKGTFELNCGKDAYKEHMKKVIDLVGEDSKLGIECAKELAKEQEKKGVCFIATAVYGSYSAPEVLLLRSFRDRVLLSSTTGRLFVWLYYRLSPPVAKIIGRNSLLKQLVRNAILRPIIRIVHSRLD